MSLSVNNKISSFIRNNSEIIANGPDDLGHTTVM